MSVYLFTYHAYRSWTPDNPRGFVQDGKDGIQPPNHNLAAAYDQAAKFPPFHFEGPIQRYLLWVAYDVCSRRKWRLHGLAFEPTHLHALVSWSSGDDWPYVRGKIKNIMSLMLSKRSGEIGRRWFVDQASRKHVRDQEHFDYLMGTYLPKHTGLQWYEGDAAPLEPPPSGGG